MSIDFETQTVENKKLVLDLVEWIARQSRSYLEVMDAWRTSCPRFPIWEDAVALGLVTHTHLGGHGATVCVTPVGRAFLRSHGRISR
ncbi:MAG: hypothetical protein M3O21_03555 [Chloroflexota bacterium]|nr:hypothetical protein [Chloroflexota bacterium]